MPEAVINGAKLWFDVSGTGEPILLHHGYTASRVNWAPVAEILKQHYQVIMMECRGTGASEHTAHGYTLEQYALDVIGLMDHLSIDRLTYAGHSMGGGIGFVLATEHADRLNGLVLMAPIPSGGTGPIDEKRLAERVDALRRQDESFFMDGYRASIQMPELETEAWFADRTRHLLSLSEGHLTGGAETMSALRVSDQLASVTLPTLMIAGSADGLLPYNIADYRALPNADLCVISRAGHETAVHAPEEVAGAIHRFMQFGPAPKPRFP